MTRIAVVGAGLSGLSAALFSARSGAEVALVAFGEGGLTLSHGGIELWNSASPSRSIGRLPPTHPYSLAGKDALRSGLDGLQDILKRYANPLEGGISRNRYLLTAAGSTRAAAYAPLGAAVLDQLQDSPAAIAALPGLQDYYPQMIVRNAASLGLTLRPTIELPMIDIPERRAVYAIDLARRFEIASWRQQTIRAWKPKLTGINRLVLPACLGVHSSALIRSEIETELGLQVYEIPLLPPTVPGIRLKAILRRELDRLGVDIIEGANAIGRFDGGSGGRRTAGLVLETAVTRHSLDADAVILATGGALHGGIVALQSGGSREPVYQIPLNTNLDRAARVSASPFLPQTYSQCGVKVNNDMQPLGPSGQPFLENLFAAGGVIAESDQTEEGCRQGIDLATAFKASQSALQLASPGRSSSKQRRT